MTTASYRLKMIMSKQKYSLEINVACHRYKPDHQLYVYGKSFIPS